MASIFTHAAVAVAIGKTSTGKKLPILFFLAGAFCAVIPDIDAIGFFMGVPYNSLWGHRGITHSIIFSILLGTGLAWVLTREEHLRKHRVWLMGYLVICGLSHGILDAMTNGGLGVAFFAPFNDDRYFLPWRPIRVSPMGVSRFFSEYGLRVIQSELLWVWVPCFIITAIAIGIRRLTKKVSSRE